MKDLNKLTIKEFNYLIELLNEKKLDLVSIFELLEEDYKNMSAGEFQKKWNNIKSFTPQKTKIREYQIIKNKKYKVILDLTKLKAGQFIDLQNIIQNGNKLEDIISLILIPTKVKFFRLKELEYGEGYDILQLRNDILNNMTIGDAFTLSTFFLQQSQQLLKVTQDHLMKKIVKEKMKTKIPKKLI